MTEGLRWAMAVRTRSRSSRSTWAHVARACSAGCRDRTQPTGVSPDADSSSIRWLPAKPPAPVTRTGPGSRAVEGPATGSAAMLVLRLVVGLEGGIALLDRPPPPLVLLVPAD